MKVLFALAGLLLACTASAQKPTAAATVDKTNQEPCTVAGQVVRLGESTPLRKANVQLLSVEPDGTSVATRTGEDGKFRFDKITPGRYRLMVTRHGYVPQEFGQRKPSDSPANLS
jgi:Carboxypeptidase regulatory-like domain